MEEEIYAEICQNVQKVDYQVAEVRASFRFLNEVAHWS